MDALIQALADIDSKGGEHSIARNPTACQICNSCEGWENESVTPKDRKFVVKKWPTPGFEIRTDVQTLIDTANSGCPTCGIFACAVKNFLPKIGEHLEVRGWLPMSRGSFPVLWIKPKGVEDNKSGFKFEFFTIPGNSHPSCLKFTLFCLVWIPFYCLVYLVT
jgi:hypothetical protein